MVGDLLFVFGIDVGMLVVFVVVLDWVGVV